MRKRWKISSQSKNQRSVHEANLTKHKFATTKIKITEITNYLPVELISDRALSADFVGDVSGDFFFDSAVSTEERAATAAALCEPWLVLDGLEAGECLLAED